ncbi:hypothetical protein [uncultured Thiodictyon sp.]|uniref:defense against restriction DarA-related protein n=1 Tax=uncultured Thiodictyon sp. TaxID=1846217 RepID=UPI0025DDCD10|nr:hypothetical protein [uncultured Thiodictyon sp.]
MTTPEYRYALVNRPAGYAQVPPGPYRVEPRPVPGQDHYEWARHGIIVYGRELTEKEQGDYELAKLFDGAERASLARKIATTYDPDDTPHILSIAEEDPNAGRQSVAHALRKLFGRRALVGDMDAFARQVLAAMTPPAAPAGPPRPRARSWRSLARCARRGRADA